MPKKKTKPKKPKVQPKPQPTMRIQLQRDDDDADLDSRVLHPLAGAKEKWVTTSQVIAALDELKRSPKLPGSEHDNADAARDKAVQWVTNRPPHGVTTTGQGKGPSFGFDKDRPYNGFRFDIENLRGHNLRTSLACGNQRS